MKGKETIIIKNESYEEFVEKFKPKKTTDDCYTPPNIYEAVSDWVANEYNVDKAKFCRPFYPGGNYENYDYSGKIVVDNPPFSIISLIVSFYMKNNIKFFLFCPTLVSLVGLSDLCTAILVGVTVTYENGAEVCTSFVTNMDNAEIRMRTAPSLYAAVDLANKMSLKSRKKQLPQYSYPLEVITAAAIYPYNKCGIDFVIPRSESVRISALDSQRDAKKGIFGSGLLISKRLAAEREKAERERAERWKLSEREIKIVETIGAKHDGNTHANA